MAARSRTAARRHRHQRVRLRVQGTADRPRLTVFRSLHHIYAQVIDDTAGRTLVAASTAEAGGLAGRANREGAAGVGRLLGERAKEAGVARVVFDRGGYLYHGRVQALAEAARETGLEF